MRCIEEKHGELAFIKALELTSKGVQTSPRGMHTVEVPGPVSIYLDDARTGFVTNPYRRLNYAFGFAETLQIWAGNNTLERLTYYNKKMAEYSDNGVTLEGSYGPPFCEQLPYIIDTLTNDRDSRQAVLTIWRPSPRPSKDIPCTVMMHFLIRDFKLHLTVYMRSNDVWLGLPYDMMTFTTLQQAIASMLKVNVGSYHHIAGSLHLYAGDVYKSAWATKYPGPLLVLDTIEADDLSKLSKFEAALRIHDRYDTRIEHQSSYCKTQSHLLLWWHNKKKDITKHNSLPEPYNTMMEISDSVKTKVAGS